MDEQPAVNSPWVVGYDAQTHTPKNGEELTHCDQCDLLVWTAIEEERPALCPDCSSKRTAALHRAAQKGFHFGL